MTNTHNRRMFPNEVTPLVMTSAKAENICQSNRRERERERENVDDRLLIDTERVREMD